MNSNDIVKLARECGGRFELGHGDEPTAGGMMFWQEGRRKDEYPSLLKFAEAICRKERARLLLEVHSARIPSLTDDVGGRRIGKFDTAMLDAFRA